MSRLKRTNVWLPIVPVDDARTYYYIEDCKVGGPPNADYVRNVKLQESVSSTSLVMDWFIRRLVSGMYGRRDVIKLAPTEITRWYGRSRHVCIAKFESLTARYYSLDIDVTYRNARGDVTARNSYVVNELINAAFSDFLEYCEDLIPGLRQRLEADLGIEDQATWAHSLRLRLFDYLDKLPDKTTTVEALIDKFIQLSPNQIDRRKLTNRLTFYFRDIDPALPCYRVRCYPIKYLLSVDVAKELPRLASKYPDMNVDALIADSRRITAASNYKDIDGKIVLAVIKAKIENLNKGE